MYPAECGEQLGRDPSKIGSAKSLVLKRFSGEGTLWDSSLPISLTLWDTPALFYAPTCPPPKWQGLESQPNRKNEGTVSRLFRTLLGPRELPGQGESIGDSSGIPGPKSSGDSCKGWAGVVISSPNSWITFFGGSQKGGFQKGGFGGCSPRNENRNEGTFAKTTLLEAALLSPNDPFWC